jgi:hypothetical protein
MARGGKRLMSVPSSAMSTCAAAWADPTDLIQPVGRRLKGAISASMWVFTAAMSALAWSIRDSIVASRKA